MKNFRSLVFATLVAVGASADAAVRSEYGIPQKKSWNKAQVAAVVAGSAAVVAAIVMLPKWHAIADANRFGSGLAQRMACAQDGIAAAGVVVADRARTHAAQAVARVAQRLHLVRPAVVAVAQQAVEVVEEAVESVVDAANQQ